MSVTPAEAGVQGRPLRHLPWIPACAGMTTLMTWSDRKLTVEAALRLHSCERAKWTLYIGVTSDLASRVWSHRTDAVDGFTKRYRVHRLVYAEFYGTMLDAITREKQLKRWRRTWKLDLIEAANPQWHDLYGDLV